MSSLLSKESLRRLTQHGNGEDNNVNNGEQQNDKQQNGEQQNGEQQNGEQQNGEQQNDMLSMLDNILNGNDVNYDNKPLTIQIKQNDDERNGQNNDERNDQDDGQETGNELLNELLEGSLPDSTKKPSEIFYYLVVDTDIGLRNNIGKTKPFIFGGLSSVAPDVDFLPVLFDEEEVKNIGGRLLHSNIDKGTGVCSTNPKNKCYPVFGVVALGYKCKDGETLDEKLVGDLKDIDNYEHTGGKRDYKSLFSDQRGDMTVYIANGVKRGVVHESGMSKLELVQAKYITTPVNKYGKSHDIKMSRHCGCAILNSYECLSSDDVAYLVKLYDNNGEYVKELSGDGQEGGDAYYKPLYKAQKQRYLKLKKLAIERGLSV